MIRRNFTRWAIATVAVGALACSDHGLNTLVQPSDLALSPATLSVGDTVRADAIWASPTTANPRTWMSSDSSIISVLADGTLIARSAGTARVSTFSTSSASSAIVSVESHSYSGMSIAVSIDSTSIATGGTARAVETVRDNHGSIVSGLTVLWSSSNAAIATVSSSGIISGVASGEALVYASYGSSRGSAPIAVSNAGPAAAVGSVTVSFGSPAIAVGTRTAGTATLRDAAGKILTGRNVTWMSSDPSVAAVSMTGDVAAIAPGTAMIAATSESKRGHADVTVFSVPGTLASVSVALNPSSVGVGQTSQAIATFISSRGGAFTVPSDSVRWTTSNSSIATVGAGGLVTAVGAGGASVTATAMGKAGTASLTVSAVSGTVVIGQLSRDAGSTNGGAVLRISGSGFGASDVVRFGTISATGVTLVDASTLKVTTPPQAVGIVSVSVTHNGATTTRASAFEYLPAPSVTFFKSDFENGTLAPFYADGDGLSLSTATAYSGKTSAVGTRTRTGGAGLAFNFGNPGNPALTEPNGVYLRWYVNVPTATVNNVQAAGGQIKLTLFRQVNGSGQPGWLMCGLGSSFRGLPLTCFVDNSILSIPGGLTGVTMGDGVWQEIETWQRRSNGTGRARMWINGKAVFDYSNPLMGSDDPRARYWARFGMTYTESPTGPVSVYVDNVAGANGFIDP